LQVVNENETNATLTPHPDQRGENMLCVEGPFVFIGRVQSFGWSFRLHPAKKNDQIGSNGV